MTSGTTAPPEMAMHIRPLNSLARSGFSSTVIEKSIGQMLANPRPAATTPAMASTFEPVISAPAPINPSSADSRKHVRGVITVSTAPPNNRPIVSNKKKNAGPKLLAVFSSTANAFHGRKQKPAHA